MEIGLFVEGNILEHDDNGPRRVTVNAISRRVCDVSLCTAALARNSRLLWADYEGQ
jgi:hypothetical protein